MNLLTSRTGAKIELQDLGKTYAGSQKPALQNINLTIEPGEFICFLGPSGSGKTTTLNLIAGLEHQSEGSVYFDGKDVSKLPTYKRNIGMVFQSYALFPHLTVGDNVAFPLRRRGVARTEIKHRVIDALKLVDLDPYADRKTDALSGGQRQRVALARALVYEPSILLMDEPLGALDKALRGQLQDEIRELHQRLGMTVIFVTHDQEEALALADVIAIFNEGGLHQIGSGRDLYYNPKDLFVTKFLGDANTVKVEPSNPWLSDLYEQHNMPDYSDRDIFFVVRPEHIYVDHESMASGHVGVNGTVHQVVHLGGLTEIEIDTAELGRLRVRNLSQENHQFVEGQRVSCKWAREQTIFVPA